MRLGVLLLVLAVSGAWYLSSLSTVAAQACSSSVRASVDVLERELGEVVALRVNLRAATDLPEADGLTRVRFTSITNGVIEAGGRVEPVPGTVTLNPRTSSWSFVLRKVTRGSAFLVSYVASDRCGDMQSFAGAGMGTMPQSPPPTATATVPPVTPVNPTATPTQSTLPTAVPTATPTSSPSPTATPAPSPSPTMPPRNTKLFGIALAGAEFTDSRLPGRLHYDYVYPDDSSSYRYYAGKGQTLLRLPFRWERIQRTAFGPLSEQDVAGIRGALDTAAASGQRVILDLHNYGRYYEEPVGRADAARLADVWIRLAREFRGHPGLFGYELMNEPYDLPEGSDGWAELCQAVTNAIRREDVAAWILIPGYGWQSGHTWPENNRTLDVRDPAGRLLYAAHQYFDQNNTGKYSNGYDADSPAIGVDRLRPFTNWLSQRNAMGILTEYGVPDSDPRWLDVLNRFLGALESEPRIVGGTYWAGGPWWASYPLAVEPRNGQDRPQMNVLIAHPSR